MMRNVRILVTGAAGFIGSHVVHTLSGIGTIVGLDDLSTGSLGNLEGTSIEFIEGSVLDRKVLSVAMEDCEAIVHLAALPSVPRSIVEPLASHEVNVTGTLHVLEEARRQRDSGGPDPLVIVASSSSVYGANDASLKHEELATKPVSPYAVSKLAAEQYAIAWQQSYGLRTLALRFFNVFGPRQEPNHAYAAVIPSFIQAALRNKSVIVHGDGQQSRDFTFIENVSEVIADAVVRGVTHEGPVNLAFGSRTSLLELLHQLESIVEHDIPRTHIDARTGDVRHSQADSRRLRDLFPDVTPVPLETGLRTTVEWMRQLEDG